MNIASSLLPLPFGSGFLQTSQAAALTSQQSVTLFPHSVVTLSADSLWVFPPGLRPVSEVRSWSDTQERTMVGSDMEKQLGSLEQEPPLGQFPSQKNVGLDSPGIKV
jgi:hypothetical protein